MTIAEKIKGRRKELDMTQKELAEILSVSNKVVSKWETGTSLPDVVMCKELARVLEIDLLSLIESEDYERASKKKSKKAMVIRLINYYSLALLLTCISMFTVYLPDTVPTHFNINGEANAFGSKYVLFGALIGLLAVAVAANIFMSIFYYKRKNERPLFFLMIASLIVTVIIIPSVIATMVLAGREVEFNSLGGDMLSILTIIFFGFLLIIFGSGLYLVKNKINLIMGIRTKWSMESITVWEKTHLLGALTFLCGGFIVVVCGGFLSFVPYIVVAVTVMIISLVIPIVASYKYSTKEKE